MPGRVDTNIILRYLSNEPAEQAERAARLFAEVGAGDAEVWVEDVMLAEVVWTLTSFYRMPRADIGNALLQLLADDGVQANDKGALRLALVLYAQRSIDFADALLAAKALQSGDPVVYSFDRDFDRIPGVVRIEP